MVRVDSRDLLRFMIGRSDGGPGRYRVSESGLIGCSQFVALAGFGVC